MNYRLAVLFALFFIARASLRPVTAQETPNIAMEFWPDINEAVFHNKY